MTEQLNYLDLFSGIGGFHLGLKRAGFKFEWTGFSEIDKYAKQEYQRHFPESENLGNVTEIKINYQKDRQLRNGKSQTDTTGLQQDRRLSDINGGNGGRWGSNTDNYNRKRTDSTKQTTITTGTGRTIQFTEESISLLSGFHARIYQWLEREKDWMENVVVYFMRLCESLKLPRPKFLSLKMSKDSTHRVIQTEQTLSQYCEKLPHLGFMSVNGRLLILDGFYPKIESEYILSDILEEEVNLKYFLSQKKIKGLLNHKKEQKEQGRGFGITILTPSGEEIQMMEQEQ
jgi:hypothetical protein